MRDKTDILFVNPPSPDGSIIIRDLNRSGRTSRERIIWPQTSLAYLAAMVPELKAEIIDCIAEKITWKRFEKIILEKRPRYVVGHVITSLASNDFKTFRIAKKYVGSITISMGPHVTELTDESFKACPSLDYIIRGEPEITFKETISTLEKNKSRNLGNIKGLAYRKKEKIIINPDRPFIKNLDILPIPRHDLLPLKRYAYPFIAENFTFIVPSRGCPFPCTFCRQPIMWDYTVRLRSANSIMKELRFLKSIGINNFLTLCDTFTIDKKTVIELCKMMVKEKLNMNWACNSRTDTIDKEMAYWMKKAGCWMIAVGIESGSDKILKNVKKRATVKDAIRAVNIISREGIKVYGYFIIGLPGETHKTVNQTIELAKSLPLTFAIFHVASPYPGTEFYKEAKAKGWLNFSKWEDVDQGRVTPINYPGMSSKQILREITRCYLHFYMRPKQVLKLGSAITNPRDIKHLIRLAINHLRW